MGKLKSRKLWATVITATVGTLMTQLGLGEETTQNVLEWLQMILFGYLGSQGAVDVAAMIKGGAQ